MKHYLRTNIKQVELQKDVFLKAAENESTPFKFENMTDADLDAVANFAFESYFDTIMLCGTPDKCSRLVESLAEVGVDEIACLVDFGLPLEAVLDGLNYLDILSKKYLRADAEDVKSLRPAAAVAERAVNFTV
jgi:hypothetical protein